MSLKTPQDIYQFDYRQLRMQDRDWHLHPMSEIFSFNDALGMSIDEKRDNLEWQSANRSRWAAMLSYHQRLVRGELEWREIEKRTEEALGNFYCWAQRRRDMNRPQSEAFYSQVPY